MSVEMLFRMSLLTCCWLFAITGILCQNSE